MVGVIFEKLIGDFQAFSIYFLIVQALKIQVYDYEKVKFFDLQAFPGIGVVHEQ